MLFPRRTCFGAVFLVLWAFTPISSAQSLGKEMVVETITPPMMEAPDGDGAQPTNPNNCGIMFHLPLSGITCPPPSQVSLLASQKELDHLKTMLADNEEVLKTLQEEATLEDEEAPYQDIVSQALPDVREAIEAFYEILGKFLQELEDHNHAESHPQLEDEKKKLKEHFRMMDHLLRVTGHLADQMEEEFGDLLVSLTEPSEKPTTLAHENP